MEYTFHMAQRLEESTYWILTVLAGGKRHGYAILREVAELSGDRVRLKVTTLYAALDRLERGGLVRGDGEETVDGRRRRYLTLTGSGATTLAEEAEHLRLDAERAMVRLRAHGWGPVGTSTATAR